MTAEAAVLVMTIGLFAVYIVGVGGTTATAIRARESWRQRTIDDHELAPKPAGEVVLSAPALRPALLRLRTVGWAAFVPALALAAFTSRDYPWVAPVEVVVMVALNAFYFTAMQGIGEQLSLTPDGFRIGSGRSSRFVRWIHVTQLTGARVGAFTGMKMAEDDEWQDPRVRPNVILYRLNRALTPTQRPLLHRLIGFSYFDGVIRNAFGVPTATLLRSMREWQKRALQAEKLPLGPAR